MSNPNITLHDYEAAERAIAHESATTGVAVHCIIPMLVCAGLIIININLTPEFPWSAFAVGGMLIGLLAHWWFGYIKLDDQLTRQQQQQTEARTASTSRSRCARTRTAPEHCRRVPSHRPPHGHRS